MIGLAVHLLIAPLMMLIQQSQRTRPAGGLLLKEVLDRLCGPGLPPSPSQLLEPFLLPGRQQIQRAQGALGVIDDSEQESVEHLSQARCLLSAHLLLIVV
ncbi:hypothetical protein KSB_85920 [Ktedonobacter robiniae]|uniref:CNNM transmembrane domain-containing protein n=1 Tax=Ktedonobacter robiniae TaxID=2778365 RepID=A0ABQ3V695_9CHLR|nr:hypothetical protein KSB_85920 [Ktedonobacter robiniae]